MTWYLSFLCASLPVKAKWTPKFELPRRREGIGLWQYTLLEQRYFSVDLISIEFCNNRIYAVNMMNSENLT
jgi:hypothetical protein